MGYTIELLSGNQFVDFETFLLRQQKSLLYYSNNFRKLLEHYIGCLSYYVIAKDKNKCIVGVFPLMITNSMKYGNVANSLPYYGSNGSPLVSDSLKPEDKRLIIEMMTQKINKIIEENKCVASTFITNPFDSEVSIWFNENLDHNFKDYRIGQITKLPNYSEQLEDELMKLYSDPRPRNIRKAVKSGISVRFSTSKEDMDFLYSVHKDNIDSIGGKSKEYRFFLDVMKYMPKESYEIIIAELEQKPVAALLLFYYNKTVEYFTPATVHEFRNLQPSSLIIHEGMKRASEKGFKYWNWGGTWKTQSGVYDFKKKWGAEDYQYDYFTKIYNKDILKTSANELLEHFSHTFVVPFEYLEK